MTHPCWFSSPRTHPRSNSMGWLRYNPIHIYIYKRTSSPPKVGVRLSSFACYPVWVSLCWHCWTIGFVRQYPELTELFNELTGPPVRCTRTRTRFKPRTEYWLFPSKESFSSLCDIFHSKLFIYLLMAYGPVNRSGSPQGFSRVQISHKLNTIQNMHIT